MIADEGGPLELQALHRVATLVAEGVQPHDLFGAVAGEGARVFTVPIVHIARYELDDTVTLYASFSDAGPLSTAGTRRTLDGTSVLRLVRASGQAARIDDYADLLGALANDDRFHGI